MPEDVTGCDAADTTDPTSSAIVASGVNKGVEKEGDGVLAAIVAQELTADNLCRGGEMPPRVRRTSAPILRARRCASRLTACPFPFEVAWHDTEGRMRDRRGRVGARVLNRYGIGAEHCARHA